MHGVRLEDGQARWYRNRWVRPDAGDFAPNTNVVEHAGRTLALVEAGSPPYELTDELDTVGRCDFAGTVRRPATPPTPTRTRRPASCTRSPTPGPAATSSTTPSLGTTGRVRHQVEVEVHGQPDDPRLRADRALRRDLRPAGHLRHRAWSTGEPPRPLSATATRCPTGPSTSWRAAPSPTQLPYSWDDDYPARIGLLPRDSVDGAGVRWFEIDPCYVFHTLNAFEVPETGEVVIDAVRHDRMFATEFTGPDEGPASLVRFTLDPAVGQGPRAPLRRALAGVPALRRAADRAAAPLRLRRRLRRRRPRRHRAQARHRGGHHAGTPARTRHGGRRVLLRAVRARRRPRTTAC